MVLFVYIIYVYEVGGDFIMYVCLFIMLLFIVNVFDLICMYWYDIIDDNV